MWSSKPHKPFIMRVPHGKSLREVCLVPVCILCSMHYIFRWIDQWHELFFQDSLNVERGWWKRWRAFGLSWRYRFCRTLWYVCFAESRAERYTENLGIHTSNLICLWQQLQSSMSKQLLIWKKIYPLHFMVLNYSKCQVMWCFAEFL